MENTLGCSLIFHLPLSVLFLCFFSQREHWQWMHHVLFIHFFAQFNPQHWFIHLTVLQRWKFDSGWCLFLVSLILFFSVSVGIKYLFDSHLYITFYIKYTEKKKTTAHLKLWVIFLFFGSGCNHTLQEGEEGPSAKIHAVCVCVCVCVCMRVCCWGKISAKSERENESPISPWLTEPEGRWSECIWTPLM